MAVDALKQDFIVTLTSRKPLLSLVLFAALACDGGPSSLSTGDLSISVLGLPAGSSAAVTVTGPNGYNQLVSGSQTLSQLVSGTYTLAASNVTVGSAVYSASPASQSVIVGASTANASIFYTSGGGGSLALTINGLGTSSTAAVTVTGPNSYTQSVGSTRTLGGLTPGSYTVTARDTTAAGGTPHTAAPATQNVTVTASGTASATVTYSPPSGGPLNLRIAGLYITQSTQTYGGTVPLVKNRNGYLRVFVIANGTNTAAPNVRVRFYNVGPLPIDSTLILPQGLSVPTAVDESSLSYTWNVPVSGTLIQPGLSIQAEVDPGNLIVEDNETDNLFPAVGQLGTDIRTVPPLRITFVPILQTANGLQGNVTNGNKDAFLDLTKRMHPIDAVDAVVGAPYSTPWTLQANGDGWAELLGEFDLAMIADGRYYYGVAKVSYSSGVAGVAYVSSGSNEHAALGWDYLPSGAAVVAHELGHNWGRNHAPCGGPGGLDDAYPHPDGRIGVFGLDVAAQSLKPATTSDIMGYCDPKWISDYSYRGVLDYRIAHPLVMSAEAAQPVQPSLLVWGHIRDGELFLEPSFQVNTRPRLPLHPGPYSIEARADDGTTLFALSFAPNEVADVPGSRKNFAFAIPLPAAKAARLSSLRLAGRGREAISAARVSSAAQVRAGVQSDSVEVRRVGPGRVALRWNAGAHPMVMVRDAETGQVLSFARGGAVELLTSRPQVDLVLSNGLKSRLKRVRIVQ